MLSIAYGSNISEKRMRQRCPSAQFIAKGYLDDTVLCFHYYADIERAHGYITPAVLWEIADDEIENLDRAEGFPNHYKKESLVLIPKPQLSVDEMIALVGADNVHVARNHMDVASGIWGTAYIMTDWKKNKWEKHNQQTPIEYVEHFLTGYKEQDFIGCYLHDLWYALYRGENPPEYRGQKKELSPIEA